MKFRSDFVTNSSSSSYIVAFKSFKELEEKVADPMLTSLIDIYYELMRHDGTVIDTIEELNEHFMDDNGWRKDQFNTIEELLEVMGDWAKEQYQKLVEKINNGYAISFFRVEYDAIEMTDRILENLGNFVEIIEDE